MNLFAHFHAVVLAELAALAREGVIPSGLDLSRISVEPPRDAGRGDIATNAAMVLAKPAGEAPRALAEKIALRLRQQADIQTAEIAGPGFVNLTLKSSFWPKVLVAVLDEADAFGRSSLGKGVKANVEYVSANPTGPLHVGHCRGAVFGDALANLLEAAGFAVTREYYINDSGGQVDVLARSAFLRYREALGEDIGPVPEGLYPGDYLKPVGAALAKQYVDKLKAMPESEWLPLVRS